MKPSEVFRKNMRAARTSRGWSQLDLANEVGVEQAVISRLERGLRFVLLDEVFVISAALGYSPMSLCEEERSFDA